MLLIETVNQKKDMMAFNIRKFLEYKKYKIIGQKFTEAQKKNKKKIIILNCFLLICKR